ncbi:MAG: glycosyltransferase family 4 protein [Rhodospirillales bacterium]|nr:glycosyltransferase family 4 protein [Rhodospirillales bacterium]MBT4040561.1 glycosyltransferase family 4 protein [Rhodospirillales bacterium]MBT4627006.1 glycosyltransferase family 4 protein [Rhodospirillales bacterium]MBT5352235.1 glycosyltransferase family 4 protein [Rhodospirillales bacterium]MBT5520619.1 glycosyltransferase family 4 protein [Rhodospirillales bacterium]
MSTVAFVLKGYPRLSETFIAQEIRALEKRGLTIQIISLRHPTDPHRHPIHDEIISPVSYLPEYLHAEPARVLSAYLKARALPGYTKARNIWKRDLARDFSRSRIRRFGQACVLATELQDTVKQLHAHFLHTPASVTRYAAMMLELPWSCSAHAKDIYTSPEWELREKLSDCRWLVTCTQANTDFLSNLAPSDDVVSRVYHGLDFTRFPPPARQNETTTKTANGTIADDPVVILSVGRAVEKKGYDGLLHALAELPGGLHWRLIHIGGGALTAKLKSLADDLGIGTRIEWRGALPQDQVFRAFGEAHIFVLNSRIADDGDRDGLPNVLMEAQSQALACVATRVSAIPELIIHGKTGILVPPDDANALSHALSDLIKAPIQRQTLGQTGEQRVRQSFSLDGGIDDLARRFGLTC